MCSSGTPCLTSDIEIVQPVVRHTKSKPLCGLASLRENFVFPKPFIRKKEPRPLGSVNRSSFCVTRRRLSVNRIPARQEPRPPEMK